MEVFLEFQIFSMFVSMQHDWWKRPGSSFRDRLLQGEFMYGTRLSRVISSFLDGKCSRLGFFDGGASITSRLFTRILGWQNDCFHSNIYKTWGFEGAEGESWAAQSQFGGWKMATGISLYHPRSWPQYSNVPRSVHSSRVGLDLDVTPSA